MQEMHDRIGALIDAARAARKMAVDATHEQMGTAVASRQAGAGSAAGMSGAPQEQATEVLRTSK